MQMLFIKILQDGIGSICVLGWLYVTLFVAEILWHRKITNIYLHQSRKLAFVQIYFMRKFVFNNSWRDNSLLLKYFMLKFSPTSKCVIFVFKQIKFKGNFWPNFWLFFTWKYFRKKSISHSTSVFYTSIWLNTVRGTKKAGNIFGRPLHLIEIVWLKVFW